MSKKNLFLALGGILIIIVIIVLVVSRNNTGSPNVNESLNTETNSPKPQTKEELDNIYMEAGLKADMTVCDQIRDPGSRAPCQDNVVYSLAMAKKDVKICDQMKTPEHREQCIEVVSGMK